MMAARQGHKNVVEFLWQRGADLYARNQSGWTVLDFLWVHPFPSASQEEILKLIRAGMGSVGVGKVDAENPDAGHGPSFSPENTDGKQSALRNTAKSLPGVSFADDESGLRSFRTNKIRSIAKQEGVPPNPQGDAHRLVTTR